MKHELLERPAMARQTSARTARRTLADRLREAVLMLAQGRGTVLSHKEAAWASITFAGTRHSLILRFSGSDEVAAGENLVAALPDHEFSIPRQIVADATVVGVDSQMLPEPRMEVCCELLLLEDA